MLNFIKKEDLIDLYVNKKISAKEVAKILNVGRTSVLNYIKIYGIESRGRHQQKYYANDYFFSTWSSNMAYCLGFITADGHSWKDKPYITIGIHKRDKEVLEFIRDNISPNSKVRIGSKDQFQLCVRSEQIWNDLKKYNVNHEKTFNMHIDFDIPEEFWGDYLRGFFDGDGCIYSTQHKTKKYYMTTFSSASKQMLEYIQKRIGMGKIRLIRGKYFELKLHQQDTLKLYNIMYKKEDCFKMIRKYNKFKNIIIDYTFWSKEENELLMKNLHLKRKDLTKLFPQRPSKSVCTKRDKIRRKIANEKL